jgi:asparagine synthase (glutamine-hydrolysing)
VFGGYERFAAAALAARLPAVTGTVARRLARLLPHRSTYSGLRKRLERFGRPGDRVEDRYLAWISILQPAELTELGASAGGRQIERFGAFLDESTGTPLDRILHANFRTYLPDDLAAKVDRMAMAHSLEVRSPMLDTRLVELLATVPAAAKVGMRHPKPLLRAACGPLIPAEIWRRPKHGFGSPVDTWFDGALGDVFADEALGAGAAAQAMLDGEAMRRLFDDHRAGRTRAGAKLWTLLTIERWLRECRRPAPFASVPDPVLDAAVR